MNDSDQKSLYIESARREYGGNYEKLKWVSAQQASAAAAQREELLYWLENHGTDVLCGGTKPFCSGLSPGCRTCTAGEWSCLFINGLCNGSCFFCPTDQTEMGEPTTQTIQFADPEDYVDYIGKFGFKGVSMSGGEPLLSFNRTIRFISAVKENFGSDIHLWIYTNGKLVTREKLQALKQAGVDEIRFNIYAHHDYLDRIKIASALIETVTVEVPAVPEHFDEFKIRISDLKKNGVKFLNLHQLRLTPYNFRHLANRNYTFLHGPRVTVLESELTALNIMKYNLESGINLPINYCSFPFKNRYQRNAERRRHSPVVIHPYEDMTQTGMIRTLHIKGHPEQIQKQTQALRQAKIDDSAWKLNIDGDCLFFNLACRPHLDLEKFSVFVRYHDTGMRPSVSYKNMFREIYLNDRKKVVIERWPVCDEMELGGGDFLLSGNECECTKHKEFAEGAIVKSRDQIEYFESMQQGLSAYY